MRRVSKQLKIQVRAESVRFLLGDYLLIFTYNLDKIGTILSDNQKIKSQERTKRLLKIGKLTESSEE